MARLQKERLTNDHDEIKENTGDDVRERKAGDEKEFEKKAWSRNNPVDLQD